MSAYDVSLDDIIRSKRKKPFLKKEGAGRGQRPQLRGRGRVSYSGQITRRIGTVGRGRGGKPSWLTSNDLRLTKLGLSTKRLQTQTKETQREGKGFDLRQKITARSGQSQTQITVKTGRPELEPRTFRRALTDTVSQGRMTKPIEVDRRLEPASRSGRGIKVTIKGLGRKSSDPMQVDRRDRNHELGMGRTASQNPAIRMREVEERRKGVRYAEHVRHRPGLEDDGSELVSYKMRVKPAREELSLTTGTRLIVSNLHPSVSDRDIMELFAAVGELQSARFIDNGVAEVIYYRPDDADIAFKRYHNRNLDGRPMIVKVGVLKPVGFGETGIFERTARRVAAYQRPLSDDDIGFSVRF